jgi:hypothetical protein
MPSDAEIEAAAKAISEFCSLPDYDMSPEAEAALTAAEKVREGVAGPNPNQPKQTGSGNVTDGKPNSAGVETEEPKMAELFRDTTQDETTRLNTRCRDLNHELQYRIQQNIDLRKAVEAIVKDCGCHKCRIRTDQVIEALRGPMAHPDDVKP